ncbi:MAG: DUF4912 domain-containing protein [Treponema sp.]|nr:DUF4912 domain-containing protein [Treponema sp.]
MENVSISRSYLETLSFADLLKLADDLGIDVPEDFNRNFLIAELLEAHEIPLPDGFEDMTFNDAIEAESNEVIRGYNNTEVQVILRNPAWAFVYWNMSDADKESMNQAFVSQLRLRVSSFSQADQQKPDEYFDIQISADDSGQYVLLPAGKKFFRVDFLFNLDGIVDILASSKMFEMPVGSVHLADMRPGTYDDIPEICKLSGMKQLLVQHYKNHRESFS